MIVWPLADRGADPGNHGKTLGRSGWLSRGSTSRSPLFGTNPEDTRSQKSIMVREGVSSSVYSAN